MKSPTCPSRRTPVLTPGRRVTTTAVVHCATSASARRVRCTGGRRGAAATEFAIILPLMTMLFLGAADFGRCFYSAIAVENGARAGAAYACMTPLAPGSEPAWQSKIQQAVIDELSESRAFDTSKLTVTASSIVEGDGATRVSVQVGYPFRTLINWVYIPNTIQLQHTVVMRTIR